ncbi:glycosyltransferase [Motilimonas pumila]|nr:glycosyltransferase family 4 protein [Motilimonas pumila]
MAKKKLFVVCSSPFGYLIDTYQHAINLKNDYDVSYICFDDTKPEITEEGVEIIKAPSGNSGFKKWLYFAWFVVGFIKNSDSIIFIKYFRFCSLIRLFGGKNRYIMDVRTSSISKSKRERLIFNKVLYLESFLFKSKTVISKSVADFLGIKKYCIVPLGCPKLSCDSKSFDNLSLLYIGTLSNRDIHKTVEGIARYLELSKNPKLVSYTIIGDGFKNEVEDLKQLVVKHKLDGIVKVLGRIPFNQLQPYYDEANVGVSFVPINKHFDAQPVTKTLEYMSAGMITIGTQTKAQKEVLSDANGVLISDTAESFATGLIELEQRSNQYCSEELKSGIKDLYWESIAENLDKHVLSKAL